MNKIQLPKSLIICGKLRHITYDPKRGDGQVELSSGDILVGTESPKEVLEILMHEVAEFILYSHGHRYTRYDEGNDGLRFVMSHHDYENFIKEMTFVVEQIFVPGSLGKKKKVK